MSSKKGPTRGNANDAAGQEIRRLWGDAEIHDAKKDLRVFIAPEDVAGASRKDPAYCVFAQACRRTFHATKVLFFRSVAYVELPDSKGKRHVERFVMGEGMRPLIESFDRGKGVIPEGGFVLKAPTPGHRLDRLRMKSREQNLRHPGSHRKPKGTAAPARRAPGPGQGKGKFRDGPLAIDLSVRNGTGAVRFARRKGTQTEAEKVKEIIGRLDADSRRKKDAGT